jgi:hypothetical protein
MRSHFIRTVRSGVVHASLAMLLLVTVGVALVVPTATPAQALCVEHPMQGNWQNIDASTRSITRVSVGFHCGDQILCDPNGNCSGGESYVTLRPYGKCHPTDCDWGVRRADSMGDGWERATYTHSWATKYVWVKTYQYNGLTYLRVYVHTDFTAADGRTDYVSDEWMLR